MARRRTPPAREPLEYAIRCEKGIGDALRERGQAFLSALEGGWTMREIGDACGISASTVCRIANEAENV